MSSFDMNSIMEQAKEMHAKMQSVQNELEEARFVGVSGDNSVKVLFNGHRRHLSTKFDEVLVAPMPPSDIAPRVTEAVNDAMRQIEEAAQGQMKSLTEGMSLPEGLEMPQLKQDDNGEH